MRSLWDAIHPHHTYCRQQCKQAANNRRYYRRNRAKMIARVRQNTLKRQTGQVIDERRAIWILLLRNPDGVSIAEIRKVTQ